MEVHTHSHSSRRKWTHYLWEFFMLFLAITAGYFVENRREHYIEHRKEKSYIQSIAADLKQDSVQLDSIIRQRTTMDSYMDSLLHLLNSPGIREKGNEIYYYARWTPRTFRFYTMDRTLSQLRNAGNWRLISSTSVSNQLATYDRLVRTITVYIEQREEALVVGLYPYINKIFDNRVFESMVAGLGFVRPLNNPALLTYDKSLLNEFCNQIHFRKNANLFFIKNAERLLAEDISVINVIRENYHIK